MDPPTPSAPNKNEGTGGSRKEGKFFHPYSATASMKIDDVLEHKIFGLCLI